MPMSSHESTPVPNRQMEPRHPPHLGKRSICNQKTEDSWPSPRSLRPGKSRKARPQLHSSLVPARPSALSESCLGLVRIPCRGAVGTLCHSPGDDEETDREDCACRTPQRNRFADLGGSVLILPMIGEVEGSPEKRGDPHDQQADQSYGAAQWGSFVGKAHTFMLPNAIREVEPIQTHHACDPLSFLPLKLCRDPSPPRFPPPFLPFADSRPPPP